MAKRRMPPRYKSGPKKGQFMPKRARKRKNPPAARRATPRAAPRRRAAARKAPARRRTYRRNPARMPDLFVMLKDGTMAAGQVLVGKAAARSVPQLLNLPQQGNMGLAIQAGVALGLGYVSSMVFSRGTAAAIMAGGLTAPLETLLVANQVPWIGEALSPTTQLDQVSGYMGRYPAGIGRYPAGVGRYPAQRQVAALAGFPEDAEEFIHHHS